MGSWASGFQRAWIGMCNETRRLQRDSIHLRDSFVRLPLIEFRAGGSEVDGNYRPERRTASDRGDYFFWLHKTTFPEIRGRRRAGVGAIVRYIWRWSPPLASRRRQPPNPRLCSGLRFAYARTTRNP